MTCKKEMPFGGRKTISVCKSVFSSAKCTKITSCLKKWLIQMAQCKQQKSSSWAINYPCQWLIHLLTHLFLFLKLVNPCQPLSSPCLPNSLLLSKLIYPCLPSSLLFRRIVWPCLALSTIISQLVSFFKCEEAFYRIQVWSLSTLVTNSLTP